MTTARTIIDDALRFGLNRLSPGETLDADTAGVCLSALNSIADELNGSGTYLFRELLTSGTVTSATGTLGSTWATIDPGTQILGAYYTEDLDTELGCLTFEQYSRIADKTVTGDPEIYAWDGYATVKFWPVPSSTSVTLRTKQIVSEFADIDTDYGMPAGYRSALCALLAERMAPSLIGDMPQHVKRDAKNARDRVAAMNANPAMLGVPMAKPNILNGF